MQQQQTYRDLSRPMGALSSARAAKFQERYDEWDEQDNEGVPKWHYGSHYSSAGIVALFLIRLEPFTQHYVRLQSGRFDVPDRIFCNIQSSWCVSTPSHVSSVSCRVVRCVCCEPCCSSMPKGNRHRARRAISTCRTCASSSPNSCTWSSLGLRKMSSGSRPCVSCRV